jgi:Ferritin-like
MASPFFGVPALRRLASAQAAAFRRGGATPYAVRFAGLHGPVEAGWPYGARPADPPRLLIGPARPVVPGDREEQLRVGEPAQRGRGPAAVGHAGDALPYPRWVPHGEVALALLPFGPHALEMFLRLERPAPPSAPPQADRYDTIGQFYAAIEQGLRHLCDRLGEKAVFSGDPARQVSGTHFHHTSGWLFAVEDLESALGALEEIVKQGEVAHYYRLMELKPGRRYQRGDTPASGPTGEKVEVDLDGVFPMAPNPRPTEPGSAARDAGGVQPDLLRDPSPAGPGLQRQPEAARRSHG